MTKEWHIRILVGFMLENNNRLSQALCHGAGKRSGSRMTRSIMETPDIRVVKVALKVKTGPEIKKHLAKRLHGLASSTHDPLFSFAGYWGQQRMWCKAGGHLGA